MLKIYLEKDYDNVGWYFLSNLMSRMGIGIYMSMLYTYILGERVVSRVMLNCGFTCSLIIHKSARQGYCFESLLFFIVVLIHFHLSLLGKVSKGLYLLREIIIVFKH